MIKSICYISFHPDQSSIWFADWEKHFCRASHISAFVQKFPSSLDFFGYYVSGSVGEEDSLSENDQVFLPRI